MDQTTLIIIICGLIVVILIAYFFGKKQGETLSWGDKKKLLIQEYENRFLQLKQQYELEHEKLKSATDVKTLETEKRWKLKYSQDMHTLKKEFNDAIKALRKDAVERSRRTLLGKLWEQVSPYLPDFPYSPSDMKFLGSPVDFVIFDGHSENNLKEIIFLEVKSGDSKLTPREKKIKAVVQSKGVSFKEFRIKKVPPKDKTYEIDDSFDPELMHKNKKFKAFYDDLNEKLQSVGKIEKTFECPGCRGDFKMTIDSGDADDAHDDLKEGMLVRCPLCKGRVTITHNEEIEMDLSDLEEEEPVGAEEETVEEPDPDFPKTEKFVCAECSHEFSKKLKSYNEYKSVECPECGSRKFVLK